MGLREKKSQQYGSQDQSASGWIALVDLLEGGHHGTYLILCAQALLQLGYQVVVVCPHPQPILEVLSSNGPLVGLEEVADRLQGVTAALPAPSQFIVGRFRSRFDAISRWQVTQQSLQQYGQSTSIWPELVIFPYLDAYLSPYLLAQDVERYFSFDWSGLYMKPKHLRQQPRLSRLRRRLLGNLQPLRSRYCQAIVTLDGGVLDDLKIEAGNTPVTLFPDIADAAAPNGDYGPARAIVEQAQSRTVIGMVGSLDRRKGVRTLLDVAHQACSQSYFFALVGRFSRSDFNLNELRTVWAAIQAKPSNSFFYLESMPGEAEFNAVVNSLDILFAAYLQFPGSSNMLAKAALFRKPIIVSDGFYMAEQVRRYGLGLVVPEDDPAACLAAIATLTQRTPAAIATMEQGMAEYLRDNSFDQLVVCLERLVKGWARDSLPSRPVLQ